MKLSRDTCIFAGENAFNTYKVRYRPLGRKIVELKAITFQGFFQSIADTTGLFPRDMDTQGFATTSYGGFRIFEIYDSGYADLYAKTYFGQYYIEEIFEVKKDTNIIISTSRLTGMPYNAII